MDEVQSWWEVPCIAHFCSLFHTSLNLLDFDIEEFEEALIIQTDEGVGTCLVQDLIVRLLKGCFGIGISSNEITTSNYQMYLRRLFRTKCEEEPGRVNLFDLDVAFHCIPIRTRVEIIYDLCDFRLDVEDVQDTLKSLEAHSLRVTALGKDSGGSTYWYFYGTRLYREDYDTSPAASPVKKGGDKSKNGRRYSWLKKSLKNSKWQIVCHTEEDWHLLTSKFRNCRSKHEKSLHQKLKEDFLPELPRLFAEKEKMQRKRMLEQSLRRANREVDEEENRNDDEDGGAAEDELRRQRLEQEKADRLLAEELHREERQARLRDRRGGGGNSSSVANAGECSSSASRSAAKKSGERTRTKSKHSKSAKRKRMTNNSLAACLATGANEGESDENEDDEYERPSSPSPPPAKSSKGKEKESRGSSKSKKHSEDRSHSGSKESSKGKGKAKVKSSDLFSQSEDDIIVGMHKVVEYIKNHRDAWPFVNPVDEEYAPNYYKVVTEPMDILTMEDKLDNHDYTSVDEFKSDFEKIVENCRTYNGLTSEYTEMVETLQESFHKAIRKYIVPDESDDEITIEFEKKKSKSHSKHKSSSKTADYKKENEPDSIKSSKKKDKSEKKKRKKELMRHHAKDSAAMDALNVATAETLKDINKWLGDSPKSQDYSSSVSASDEPMDSDKNLMGDLEKAVKKTLKQLKKSKSRKETEDVDANLRKIEKTISKDKKKKLHKLDGKSKSKNTETKVGEGKHHHKKHRREEKRSSSSSSKIYRSRSPTPVEMEEHSLKKSSSSSKELKKVSKSSHPSKSNMDEKSRKTKLKSIKKPKPKLPSGLKRFGSKTHKFGISSDSKKGKDGTASGSSAQTYGSYKTLCSGDNSNSGGANANSSASKDVQDKKKCLLINNPQGTSVGGPRLSLGSVLATDEEIKLGGYKSGDSEDEEIVLKTSQEVKDLFDNLKEKVLGEQLEAEKQAAEKEAEEKAKQVEDEKKAEADRKLDCVKGFNRDKCMPNWSAWLKAFGPKKSSGGPMKKGESESKAKFKVLGRATEATEEKTKQVNKSGSKTPVQHTSPPLNKYSSMSHGEDDGLVNIDEDKKHGDIYSKDRRRKMSSGSLSSQSETGCPYPSQSLDDANRINPPRWVEEQQWGPTQSPASSHMSSQSPAGPNSPFSPPVSSPSPQAQTQPWPTAPVRVGFYQDLTLQHPSPDKSVDSNSGSNVSSPNPLPARPRSRDNYSYAANNYGQRQGGSVPSPATNSNSPATPNVNVDSPGSRSMGSVDSPQSPVVVNHHLEKVRGRSKNRSASPPMAHYSLPPSRHTGPYTSQDSQLSAPVSLRTSDNSTAINLNVNATNFSPSIRSATAKLVSYMNDTGNPVSAHSGNSYHDNIHSATTIPQPAHSGGKYPIPAPAHRQPPLVNHDHPGISSASAMQNHGVIVSGIHSNVFPTNLSSNMSQPPGFPGNLYAGAKGILAGAEALKSTPDGRYYKANLPSGIMTPSIAHNAPITSSSRGRKSSANHSSKSGSPMTVMGSPVPGVSPDLALLEGKLGAELNVNGIQWPHNLASLTQIVNSIPNPMALASPGLPSAYRAHFDANVASAVENMSKYQRYEAYAAMNAKNGGSTGSNDTHSSSGSDKSQASDREPAPVERRSKNEKSSRSQSSGKSGGFGFAALPPDIAMYSKEMADPGSLYGSSSPSLAHPRSELYPASSPSFHPSFSSSVKTTAGGVPGATLPPYPIPPFVGSHPSPYQPQPVSSQPSPFSHTQGGRGMVDPYQQFFTGSPHVMGLLPPTSYAGPFTHPHHSFSLNRPGWI